MRCASSSGLALCSTADARFGLAGSKSARPPRRRRGKRRPWRRLRSARGWIRMCLVDIAHLALSSSSSVVRVDFRRATRAARLGFTRAIDVRLNVATVTAQMKLLVFETQDRRVYDRHFLKEPPAVSLELNSSARTSRISSCPVADDHMSVSVVRFTAGNTGVSTKWGFQGRQRIVGQGNECVRLLVSSRI